MIIYIMLGLVVLISALTLIPSWLRRRRLGADYDVDYDANESRGDRRQKIRTGTRSIMLMWRPEAGSD